MSSPRQDRTRNRLLKLMAQGDFARLAPHFELVALAKGYVLAEAGSRIEHAYFLESGIGSIVVTSPEGLEVEAGLFGRDGMAPVPLLMDASTSTNRILIQIADDAWRIPREPLMAAVDASPTLRRLLLRYAQALSVQTSYTALSNAVHPIDERLARWILMCDDRMDGRDMALTHEFMSIMLAVRRPSVTTALHVLEGNGFIRSERGCITVRNRAALEQFAGDAYGQPEAAYRELIGSMTERA
ncbi:MAG: Crp/Fnr family transcriptional regulator [Caulobacteraceae bacterium]|nr:Crp/Fnr family transcriptional regulator [Caulobacter sp.]